MNILVSNYFTFYGNNDIIFFSNEESIFVCNITNNNLYEIKLFDHTKFSFIHIVVIFECKMIVFLYDDNDNGKKKIKLYKITGPENNLEFTLYYSNDNMISYEENSFGYFVCSNEYYFAICTNDGLLIFKISYKNFLPILFLKFVISIHL